MKRTFHSLGFGESTQGDLTEPDRLRYFDSLPSNRTAIRGAGLSLVGAGFGGSDNVLGMRSYDRIRAFDVEAGILEVEAGATLGKLFGFLALKGWMLPVQPGYPGITIGGCIGANVHGKNQAHEGCFVDWVEELELFHPSHGRLILSAQSNPDLFDLTIGGFGLTGIILSAKLRLTRLTGQSVVVTPVEVASLDEAVKFMQTEGSGTDFQYSWHDMACSYQGKGMVFMGHFDKEGPTPETSPEYHALDQDKFAAPVGLMNRWSLSAMNLLYRRLNDGEKSLSIWQALFPFASAPAYFYLYGKRGFLEHQVLISDEAASEYFQRFRVIAERHQVPLGLATIKLFGGSQKLLRFSGKGISFAIEAPRGAKTLALFADLDELDIALGGRANLIKDARLPAAVMERQYAEASEFRDRLRTFDPDRIFTSAMAERLAL